MHRLSALCVNRCKILSLAEANNSLNVSLSSGEGITVDKKDTTTFVDDAPIVSTFARKTVLEDDIKSATIGIADFLKKPIRVASGTWNTSLAANDSLNLTGIFPGLRLDYQLANHPLWNDKMKGYSLVNATAHLRLQINANPFQSGKLLFHFIPCAESFSVGVIGDDGYVNARNACLATKTQQPYVEIDCRDTTAIMELPYITPTHYFSLADQAEDRYYDRGNVFLTVLSPLRTGTGGETTVDYSIYLHWEDVELTGNVVPQAGGRRARAKKTKNNGFGTKRYKTAEEMELDSISTKPISSMLELGSKIAGGLSTVPVLAPYTKPAAWALGVGSGVAAAMGWSKPAGDVMAKPMYRNGYRYSSTADGSAPHQPTGLLSTNAVDISDNMAYTTEDEMSFAFLKKKDAMIHNFDWSLSNNAGDLLATYHVVPDAIFEAATVASAVTGGSRSTKCGPPIFYLGQIFRKYRGSFMYHFKIAKTDYHSGRILVVYTPLTNPSVLPDLNTSSYEHRQIIDIREGNEFCFCIPWMLNVDYNDTDVPMGRIDIMVLTELRAPETAASVINFQTYVAGGDDFELAVPNGAVNDLIPFIPQGMEAEKEDEGGNISLDSSAIGDTSIPPMDTEHARLAMGEVFTSVRQLIKRESRIFQRPEALVKGNRAFRPWTVTVAGVDNTNALTGPDYGGDTYSYIAPMFTFLRGGIRITMTSANTDAGAIRAGKATLNPYVTDTRFVSHAVLPHSVLGDVDWLSTPFGPAPSVLSDSSQSPVGYEIPYYNHTRLSLIDLANHQGARRVDPSVPNLSIEMSFGASGSAEAFYRTIAEDFQFMNFIGCPPLASKSGATPTTFSYISKDGGIQKITTHKRHELDPLIRVE